MTYREFVKKGLIKKEIVVFEQIGKTIENAYKNIKSAKILIEHGDKEGGFRFAYEAMLLAGRALVFSYGFRPRVNRSHKIVVDFCEKVLGAKYRILVHKFNKMRKKRNYLIYAASLDISIIEAERSVEDAKKFIDVIKKFIQDKNPQQKLI